MTSSGRRSGFTLVELMTVVAVIGILAAMAVSAAARPDPEQRFRNAVLRLANMHRVLARTVTLDTGAAAGAPILRIFPDSSGQFTLVAVAYWQDANGDLIVDWSDVNSNDRVDGGEGEIVAVVEQINLGVERGFWQGGPTGFHLLTGPPNAPVDPATGNGICQGGVMGGRDALSYTILPTNGAIYGVDSLPCWVRILLVDDNRPQRAPAALEVTPVGLIRIQGMGA